jgi:tRNA-2-methylthio-N6-dimethylallyladenosine synthase
MPQEERVVELILKKYPYIDLVFGTHNIYRLGEFLYNAYFNKERVIEVLSEEGNIIEGMPSKRDHDRKAWVNIMFGCDEFCTYCIVPYTRGTERSRLPEDIIEEVRGLSEQGYQEVTLLGQNVNAYGKDLTSISYTFADLLLDLNKINIPRIRFTTSHPRDLDDRTIEAMAKGGNIMPHLHLPVQSGSNTILKRMNRKYTKESYLEKIKKLRELIPDISLTTDIIVGFPGETEEDFLETLDLVRKAGFEGAFTFVFSPREGTPAATYEDDIDYEIKKKRLYTLNSLINEGYLLGNKRFEGKTCKVLVDGVSQKNPKLLSGYTEHYKLVNFPGDKDLIGKIVDVKIEKAYTWHLKGIIETDNS